MSFKHILAVLIVISIALTTAHATDISTCTNLTTASTTYTLTGDVNNSQPGQNYCFKINNTGITLDCQGHRIYGNYSNGGGGESPQIGVLVNYATSVVVKNCLIDDFDGAGIELRYSNNSNITDNMINTTQNGIALWTTNSNLIKNNTISHFVSNGILVDCSLLVDRAKNNIVEINTLKDSWEEGGSCITVADYNNNTTIQNNICFNTSYGCGSYSNSDYTKILNNNITHVEWDALSIYESDYVNITNNTLYDIGSGYLDLYNSNSAVITNLVLHNSSSNISCSGNIYMAQTSDPGTPNSSYAGMGKFFDITNSTPAWIYINLSYADSEVGGISDESQIVWWKYTNGVGWTSDIGSTNGVDTANNVVYANISNFSSSFLPLGPSAGPSGPSGGVPEFSDFAWVLAAVLGAGSLLLIKRTRKGF